MNWVKTDDFGVKNRLRYCCYWMLQTNEDFLIFIFMLKLAILFSDSFGFSLGGGDGWFIFVVVCSMNDGRMMVLGN